LDEDKSDGRWVGVALSCRRSAGCHAQMSPYSTTMMERCEPYTPPVRRWRGSGAGMVHASPSTQFLETPPPAQERLHTPRHRNVRHKEAELAAEPTKFFDMAEEPVFFNLAADEGSSEFKDAQPEDTQCQLASRWFFGRTPEQRSRSSNTPREESQPTTGAKYFKLADDNEPEDTAVETEASPSKSWYTGLKRAWTRSPYPTPEAEPCVKRPKFYNMAADDNPDASATASVKSWLEERGLGRYAKKLIATGFDDFRIITNLSESDLLDLAAECGMPILHARAFVRAATSLRRSMRREDALAESDCFSDCSTEFQDCDQAQGSGGGSSAFQGGCHQLAGHSGQPNASSSLRGWFASARCSSSGSTDFQGGPSQAKGGPLQGLRQLGSIAEQSHAFQFKNWWAKKSTAVNGLGFRWGKPSLDPSSRRCCSW